MADTVYPAAPQEFSFNGISYLGQLLGFSGVSTRRHVVHEFGKRRGALVEDMEQAPRRLEVQLQFVGDDCAKEWDKFEAEIQRRPVGLLVHPIAGKWLAFCGGPTSTVNFNQAIDRIEVRIAFVESELDAPIPQDVPNLNGAAQAAQSKLAVFQQAVGTYMAEVAKVRSKVGATISSMNQVIADVTLAPNPVELALDAVSIAAGTIQGSIEPFRRLSSASDSLALYGDAMIATATDTFGGSDTVAGQRTQVETLLGNIAAAANECITAALEMAARPAQAGDCIGETNECMGAFLVLNESYKAARPPAIPFVVPALIDVVSLAQIRYGKDAATRATEIMALNRIKNPAAIPAGTVLLIPSR